MPQHLRAISFAFLIAVAFSVSSASAIEPKDIFGKWCTDTPREDGGGRHNPIILTSDKLMRMGAQTTCRTAACADNQIILNVTYGVDGDKVAIHFKWKNKPRYVRFKLESGNLLELPAPNADVGAHRNLIAYHRCR